MELYRHRQKARLLQMLMIFGAVGILPFAMVTPELELFLPLVAGILVLAAWLLGSLEVVIDEKSVTVSFGPGWIRRTIPRLEIGSVQAVRNQWWWGWGIRAIPGGWMYNVSGLDAVELRMKRGGVFRIGTDEPMRLEEALREVVGVMNESKDE
ncbi:MAG: hypothetical protein FJY67_09140 [Calditrichaeota bacterium]|nr:hypothetical protein [Calditrichota bacterium]